MARTFANELPEYSEHAQNWLIAQGIPLSISAHASLSSLFTVSPHSLYVSACLSVSLSLCTRHLRPQERRPTAGHSVSLSLCLSVSLSLCLSVSLSLCLSVSLSLCLSVSLSLCLSVSLHASLGSRWSVGPQRDSTVMQSSRQHHAVQGSMDCYLHVLVAIPPKSEVSRPGRSGLPKSARPNPLPWGTTRDTHPGQNQPGEKKSEAHAAL